jgi:hypothetical protein
LGGGVCGFLVFFFGFFMFVFICYLLKKKLKYF